MNCPKCGNELAEGSRFCINCGQPVETQLPETDQTDDNVNAEIKSISEEAELAQQEAQRVEEEAMAAIALAQQQAEEAKAKAEAAMAEAREKARLAQMAKAEAEASAAVNKANDKIAAADKNKEKYEESVSEAEAAYFDAQNAIDAAAALGVTGIPELSAFSPVSVAEPTAEPEPQMTPEEPVQYEGPAQYTEYSSQPSPSYGPYDSGAQSSTQFVPAAEVKEQSGEIRGKLLRPWTYFLLTLLYCVPVIGWIFLIIHAVSKKNTNRRYFALSILIGVAVFLVIAALGAVAFLILKDTEFGVRIKEYAEMVFELTKGLFA